MRRADPAGPDETDGYYVVCHKGTSLSY
jgi:hypothetical protein